MEKYNKMIELFTFWILNASNNTHTASSQTSRAEKRKWLNKWEQEDPNISHPEQT